MVLAALRSRHLKVRRRAGGQVAYSPSAVLTYLTLGFPLPPPRSWPFRLAWQAMRQLHPEAVAAIQSKALFSQAEEVLLAKVGSVSERHSLIIASLLSYYNGIGCVFLCFVITQTSQPKLDIFQDLLSKHPGVFHQSRTPKSLLLHWQLLKQYYLLDDQSGESAQTSKPNIVSSLSSHKQVNLIDFNEQI